MDHPHLLYAATMGFLSGFALKKTGRALAVTVGLAFAAHQLQRYLAAQAAVAAAGGAPAAAVAGLAPAVAPAPPAFTAALARLHGALDADGDGVVSGRDLAAHGRRLCAFVGAPAGACVAGGFLLGLRQG